MDLQGYFRRIGFAGDVAPTLETLRALHRLHPQAIPFESLDPFLGRPVLIDSQGLQAKLIARRRGGYCFEHNGLLLLVLRAMGFAVTPLAARVVWMALADAPPPPLSHMLLKIALPDGDVIADVGFGGQSPTAPLRLEPGLEQSTPHGDYRLTATDAGAFELEMRLKDGWGAMYRFTDAPQSPRDYEVFNWFTSTHPGSRFTGNLVASRVVGDRRLNLLNRDLAVHRQGGGVERRRLQSPRELHEVLSHDFAIDVEPAEADAAWARIVSLGNG